MDYWLVWSHLYGFSYLAGALLLYLHLRTRQSALRTEMSAKQAADYVGYVVLGILIGGRLLFLIADCLTPTASGGRSLAFYLHNPSEALSLWRGGMSFHGALMGAVITGLVFVRRAGLLASPAADETTLWAPLPIATARGATFALGRLPGRPMPSDVPPHLLGVAIDRYPWQLFEAVAMILVLFPVLWIVRYRQARNGMVFAAFISGYGVIRMVVEFFRQPGIVLFGLTGPQWLSLVMIAAGVSLMARLMRVHP